MFKVFMIVFLFSLSVLADDLNELTTNKLVCAMPTHISRPSCVSKASIEKDIQELKVLKLQEEKLSLELEQLRKRVKKK